jgi:hypothetical protein
MRALLLLTLAIVFFSTGLSLGGVAELGLWTMAATAFLLSLEQT